MMKSDDTFDLKDFGRDGLVRRTGGHTPGSIAVELASQEALVGDLIAPDWARICTMAHETWRG
jgi:hydroxyacylglutathione hydrolase